MLQLQQYSPHYYKTHKIWRVCQSHLFRPLFYYLNPNPNYNPNVIDVVQSPNQKQGHWPSLSADLKKPVVKTIICRDFVFFSYRSIATSGCTPILLCVRILFCFYLSDALFVSQENIITPTADLSFSLSVCACSFESLETLNVKLYDGIDLTSFKNKWF